MFTVALLSSFVIASRANEEKLPHPQNPVLLINPCCKLPRWCPPPLSPRRLPARLALAPSVFLAGVSRGGASGRLFQCIIQTTGRFFFSFLSLIELLRETLRSHTSPGTYRRRDGRICCSGEGRSRDWLTASTTRMTKAAS